MQINFTLKDNTNHFKSKLNVQYIVYLILGLYGTKTHKKAIKELYFAVAFETRFQGYNSDLSN